VEQHTIQSSSTYPGYRCKMLGKYVVPIYRW